MSPSLSSSTASRRTLQKRPRRPPPSTKRPLRRRRPPLRFFFGALLPLRQRQNTIDSAAVLPPFRRAPGISQKRLRHRSRDMLITCAGRPRECGAARGRAGRRPIKAPGGVPAAYWRRWMCYGEGGGHGSVGTPVGMGRVSVSQPFRAYGAAVPCGATRRHDRGPRTVPWLPGGWGGRPVQPDRQARSRGTGRATQWLFVGRSTRRPLT